MASPVQTINDRGVGRRILLAGALVGILDAAFVIVTYVWIKDVTTAERIFQGIAAGVLGKAAFQGGASTALLGVLLHFTIAYTWTILYFVVSRNWSWLRHQVRSVPGTLIVGALWGVVMWLGMDLVVVPLSHARPTPVGSGTFWFFMAQHAVMLGQPVVWVVGRGSRVVSRGS